jgi:allantoin racemase
MKIWVQLPLRAPSDEIRQQLLGFAQRYLARAARRDTEVLVRDVPTGYNDPAVVQSQGARVFAHLEILKSVLRAPGEGCDAVSIACYFDPGLHEARQLLDIPVTGLAESSMLLACMMGSRFAVITEFEGAVNEMEQGIDRLGVRSRAISGRSVRALTMSPDDTRAMEQGLLFKEKDVDVSPLLDNFKQIARGCIADGAEVIIAGCGNISPVLHQAGVTEIDGAAVIEPMSASLKLAEALVDLRKAGFPVVSRRLTYSSVPRDLVEMLAAAGR